MKGKADVLPLNLAADTFQATPIEIYYEACMATATYRSRCSRRILEREATSMHATRNRQRG